MTRCTKCDADKTLAEFPRNRSKKSGRESRCKACANEARMAYYRADPSRDRTANALWRAANKEKVAADKAAYYAANKGKVLLASTRWAAENPEKRRGIGAKYRAANPEKEIARCARWRANNPEKKYAAKARRRAGAIRAVPRWYGEFDAFAMEEASALVRARADITKISWHADHVVPLQSPLVCGLHTWRNIAVIPGVENIRKSNRYWPDMPGEVTPVSVLTQKEVA